VKAYQGETEAERRRFPRKPVKLRVSYQCLSKDKVSPSETHLAEDLGSGGLAMRSRQSLLKGQIVMITLYIPRESRKLNDADVPDFSAAECVGVNVLARVARCTATGLGNYLVGVQFLDSDGQSRERLKKFLVDYRLYQPDSPLN
jgi:c-di-GMP-binding flagellar brake protein YcgR